jgi:hypothetical protein
MDYITYRTQKGVGNIFHSELEEEESMADRNEDINELPKGSILNILKDLASSQQ